MHATAAHDMSWPTGELKRKVAITNVLGFTCAFAAVTVCFGESLLWSLLDVSPGGRCVWNSKWILTFKKQPKVTKSINSNGKLVYCSNKTTCGHIWLNTAEFSTEGEESHLLPVRSVWFFSNTVILRSFKTHRFFFFFFFISHVYSMSYNFQVKKGL